MTTSSPWSLSVKRVGVAEGESYTVHVDPNSNLASLYTEIEGVTGVKANEQRLIYRGRLLATSEQEQTPELKVTKKDPQIKDVIGLCDGQTIHLVPKPPQGGETTNNIVTQTNPNDDEAHRDESPPPIRTADSASTSSTASLLAAILGMNDEPEESTISLGEQLSRLRSARVRGRQRPNYRLQEQDLLVSDPGSMEPVRQSLMTLHTLVDSQRHPHLEGHRQWYRGQWMDVRDTVNQWLEATVVDVVRADQVLPLRQATRTVGVVQPTSDDAVSANDFEGRMRLLLEPEEGGGYRQRPNNEGVQLLLIHYNGWPHRWDEWIRSDSERIRPFRTRTRHSASVSSSCVYAEYVFYGVIGSP
jgi:Ubiquitin family